MTDSQKRLEILYDHLNRQDLVKADTILQLVDLAHGLQQGRFAEAQALQLQIQIEKAAECGMWMVNSSFPFPSHGLQEFLLTFNATL